MGAEVWSAVANDATRFRNRSFAEVLLAPAVLDWLATLRCDALAAGVLYKAHTGARDHECLQFPKSFNHEIRRDLKFRRLTRTTFIVPDPAAKGLSQPRIVCLLTAGYTA